MGRATTLRWGAGVVAAVVLVSLPCQGQVRGSVSPVETAAYRGATFRVDVEVDLGASGKQLGSYGALLLWDPAVLQYVSDGGGGQAPFDAAVVNSANAGNGELRFSDAAAAGAAGRITVMSVVFRPLVNPCVTTLLDLEFTSMYAAGTFDDLQPILAVQDGTVYVADHPFDLEVSDPLNTILRWSAIPGAASYDAIRGDLGQLFDDGTFVQLGTVVCLENGSLDTTTGLGTEPAHPDTATPSPGDGFFYLVRFYDGVADSPYGFASRCTRQRVVTSGDCP